MNRDISLEKLPKGESPYMSNVNPMEDYGAITNELGTTVDVSLPSGYNLIGDILLDNGKRVLFAVNGTNSAIYLKDGSTLSAIIAPTTVLGFSLLHQIEGVFKRNYKGEYIIYWTDNFNAPRWLNIDNPITPTTDTISQLNIFGSYLKPIFSLQGVELGGNLKSGVYQMFVQYEDQYGNKSDITGASNLIPITPSTEDMKPFKYSGAAPNTSSNKRIRMSLSNVDTNYSKIHIIAQFYNAGVATTPKEFAEITITGSTVSFDYTGNETTIDVPQGEILSLYAKYATAKTITSFSNNLYLANLTSNPDLGLQKYVNGISVDYELHDTNVITNSTSFNTETVIYNNKGFMQDDVYALYISYVLKDGSQTKAYHIPGRPVKPIDKYSVFGASPAYNENQLISTIKANWAYPGERTIPDNVLDEAIAVNSEAKWFQFFGTNDNSNTFAWGSSTLGYWENQNETYPDDENWDIYTLDSNGEGIYRDTLRATKVRHHKMPEPEIKSGSTSTYLNSSNVSVMANIIGLRIKNIPIPASVKNKIAGYKIYYAKKDQKNTLVLAQDVTKFNAVNNYGSPLAYCSTGGNFELSVTTLSPAPFDKYRIVDAKSFRLHDFNCLKNNLDISTASWVKNLGRINLKTTYAGNDADVIATYGDYTNVINSCAASWNNTFAVPAEFIRRIKTSFYLPANTQSFIGNKNTYNTTYDVYNKGGESSIFVEVYNNFATTQALIAGQTQSLSIPILTPWNYGLLINVMAYITDIHNSFDNQELVECFHNTISSTGYVADDSVKNGDTFFGINTYRVTSNLEDLPAYTLTDAIEVRYGYTVPHLSRANVLYRHQGPLATDMYFPKSNYTANPTSWVNGGTGILEIASTFDNYYGYNNDYSRGNTIYQPEIIQKGIVADSNVFSTRILRSNNSSEESVEDAFRQFPAGNYKDLDKTRGQIEVLKKDSIALIIHLTNAITKTIARDVLKTDTTVAYIGNGDIFEIPTREIKYTDIGFGGTESQWANIVTPEGYIYPDVKNRKIMSFGQSLDEISANGMIGYFQDNMRFKLLEQFPDISISHDNPANPNGIGFTATWDNTNRRYIITKRDYTLINTSPYIGAFDTYPTAGTYTLGAVIFQNSTKTFQIYEFPGVWNVIPFSGNKWNDESFTIAYYPELKSWFSFYDYKPLMYIYDHKDYWGVVNNVLWKHNSGNRGSFYGTTYESVLDVPFNEQGSQSKIFDNIQFISKYVLNGVELPAKTYDTYNIYSSNGLSGETSFTNHSRFINGTWYINDFRDMRADYSTPLLDGWNIVGTVNPNKSKLYKKRFFDNYLVLRLKHNNTDNAKVGLIFNSAKARIKER